MSDKLYGLWCAETNKWQRLWWVNRSFISNKSICIAIYHNVRHDYRKAMERSVSSCDDNEDKEQRRAQYRLDWERRGLAAYELGEDGLPTGKPLSDGELCE